MSNFLTTAKRRWSLVLSAGVLLLSSSAFAWPPTYGPELEFIRDGLSSDFAKVASADRPEKKIQLEFVEQMKIRCRAGGCEVIEVKGKWDHDYKVIYPDGWWFIISYDPACVEVIFKPTALLELEERKGQINDQIFETARQAGLHPKTDTSFHFNIGIRSAFEDDGTKFLRFFVDYANHPDLALGSLGYDINNGPPIAALEDSQKLALKKIIQKVKSGKLRTIAEIAWAIQTQVYTKSYEDWGTAAHNQAIGLKTVNNTNLDRADAPMELRTVRAQENAEKFNLVARLMEARIHFLNGQTSQIFYSALEHVVFSDEELRTRFEIYVREPGLNVTEFLPLLPEDLRETKPAAFLQERAGPLAKFKSLEPYLDLLSNSPMMRQTFVELITHPKVRGTEEAAKILSKLRLWAEEETLTEKFLTLFKKIPLEWKLPASVASDLLLKIGAEKSSAAACARNLK